MWFIRLFFSIMARRLGLRVLVNLSFLGGLCHLRVVVLRSLAITRVILPLHLALHEEMYLSKPL